MELVRPRKPTLSFNMAPLIDIVFLLIIFFMLSSSFLNPALKLTLPKAVNQDAQESEHVIVSIDQVGDIYVNTSKVSKSELQSKLESVLTENPKKSVHLRGDQEMPYKFFVYVMDTARQAGARQINIVHEAGGK